MKTSFNDNLPTEEGDPTCSTEASIRKQIMLSKLFNKIRRLSLLLFTHFRSSVFSNDGFIASINPVGPQCSVVMAEMLTKFD